MPHNHTDNAIYAIAKPADQLLEQPLHPSWSLLLSNQHRQPLPERREEGPRRYRQIRQYVDYNGIDGIGYFFPRVAGDLGLLQVDGGL